jgi:ABC-type Zn uptake system ZnuABC Zn-binding protein ZnuA
MSRLLRHLVVALPFSLLLVGHGTYAQPPAPIPVVTTLPFLKEFVERVGGASVTVTNLINGAADIDTYTPTPDDLVAVGQARLLVQLGVGMEAWTIPMIKAANNPHIAIVTAGRGVPLLRDSMIDNADATGNAHGSGNPHIWLDPENAKMMIRTITDAMIKIAPAKRAAFLANQARYLKAIDVVEATIKQQVRRLKDRRIVTDHATWPYFARRFGFQIMGVIAEAQGETSMSAQADLTALIRRTRIKVIVTEPHLSSGVARTVAEQTGAELVTIASLPGTLPATDTYLDMLSYDARQLIEALSRP